MATRQRPVFSRFEAGLIRRILPYLERRGAITVVTALGDGELTVAGDETLGETDPLLLAPPTTPFEWTMLHHSALENTSPPFSRRPPQRLETPWPSA